MYNILKIIFVVLYVSTLSAQNFDIKALKNAAQQNNIDPKTVENILKSNDIDNIPINKLIENQQNEAPEENARKEFETSDKTNISVNKINTKQEEEYNIQTGNLYPIKNNISKKNDISKNLENDAVIYLEPSLPYYGYDIFLNEPGLFQKANVPVSDPNHVLSPTDEIILMIWGQVEINKSYTISNDGYLFIDNIGQIFVNGLTFSELEEKLFRHLKKVYASLDGGSNATSFLDLSLGVSSLRPKRIFALGEVSQPGAYEVTPSTTLFSSIFHFNGPTLNGSLRDIHLIRDGKKINSIDFYSYVTEGIKVNDENLITDDVIFIPTRGKTIKVAGEINRPAIYEIKEDESLFRSYKDCWWSFTNYIWWKSPDK